MESDNEPLVWPHDQRLRELELDGVRTDLQTYTYTLPDDFYELVQTSFAMRTTADHAVVDLSGETEKIAQLLSWIEESMPPLERLAREKSALARPTAQAGEHFGEAAAHRDTLLVADDYCVGAGA